jgi:hypothetical protein
VASLGGLEGLHSTLGGEEPGRPGASTWALQPGRRPSFATWTQVALSPCPKNGAKVRVHALEFLVNTCLVPWALQVTLGVVWLALLTDPGCDMCEWQS